MTLSYNIALWIASKGVNVHIIVAHLFIKYQYRFPLLLVIGYFKRVALIKTLNKNTWNCDCDFVLNILLSLIKVPFLFYVVPHPCQIEPSSAPLVSSMRFYEIMCNRQPPYSSPPPKTKQTPTRLIWYCIVMMNAMLLYTLREYEIILHSFKSKLRLMVLSFSEKLPCSVHVTIEIC